MRSRARSLLVASGAGLAAASLLLAPASAPADVVPFVDCVVAPVPPSATAKIYFGYANDGAQTSIVFGDANQVVPGLGYQGQPEVFSSGTFPRVFHAIWNTAAFTGVSWELNGHSAIATATSPRCVAGTTGPVADLAPTSATLTGTAGGGGAATYAFEYGTGAEPDRSGPSAVAAPGRARLVEWQLTGLQPATLYRYRLVATDADGTTAGELRSFTTPAQPQPQPPDPQPPGPSQPDPQPPSNQPPAGPPGGAPRSAAPPVLSAARLTPRTFAVRRARRGGTTLRFTLDRAVRIAVRIESPRRGVRRGGACRPPRRALRGRTCTRWTTTGTFTVIARAGPNAVPFNGWAARRPLPTGRHSLVLTPAGGGRAATVGFTIRERREPSDPRPARAPTG